MAVGPVWGARAPGRRRASPFALVSRSRRVAATSQPARPGQRYQPKHQAPSPGVGLGQPGALPLFAYSVTRFPWRCSLPSLFRWVSLALVSFSVPDGFCLEHRHFGATVLPVAGLTNRGRPNTPARGSASLPLVFVVGVAEPLACGFFVRFFSEHGPCDRLSKCWRPCGQEQLWFVRTATGPDGYRGLEGLPFPHHFLLMARALSRQPHLTPNTA